MESSTTTTPSSVVRLTELESLVVGAVGGMIETSIQMPLITWKICRQEGRKYPAGIREWYRGVFINASSLAPITALQCVANSILQRVITLGSNRNLSDVEQLACSAGAGAISALIYCPVDLLVIQQQKLVAPLMKTFNHVVHEHGVLTLYRGFFATMVRESIYTMGYLGIAPVITTKLLTSSNYPWFQQHPISSALLGACTGGIIANFLTQPADTAKTCVQSDLKGQKYPSALYTVKYLYKEKGGIPVLYKGAVPRTLRNCGAAFVISQVREGVLHVKEWNVKGRD